jgi:hypothetical protein
MRGDVVSQSGERLKSGQLGTADVTASTVANIGPGIDFYFGFGVVAATAGVAAPLTILAAALAVALLAFTVAEFTKADPSSGSFITYVETALGARAGVATALLVTVGYTVAIASVFTMSGGLVAMTLSQFKLSTVPVGTVRRDLLALADWLRCWGVSRAGMESTSDYWKPVFFLLEREGLDCVLYQASQVRALPGWPKTQAGLGLAGEGDRAGIAGRSHRQRAGPQGASAETSWGDRQHCEHRAPAGGTERTLSRR